LTFWSLSSLFSSLRRVCPAEANLDQHLHGVEKAIRYAPRGIVGIDIAGPRPNADGPYPYRTLRPLVQKARDAGLGVTIHVDEEGGEYGIAEIREVVSTLRPDRIGHGILAARDKRLMGQISEAGIVLKICPTSNLLTLALASCPLAYVGGWVVVVRVQR
jgi:adenosine deaminase